MVRVGHALLGTRGEILSLDDGFCEILGTDADAMIGRNVLDVTVPADRGTCTALMRTLQATREPFNVAKRYLRADGSPIWVTNTVSVIELGECAPMLVSTIVPIDPPNDRDSPAAMLDCARLLLAGRRERLRVFGTAMFVEPAWDMMLTAYIAEAEGVVLDSGTLSRATALPVSSASRWIRALVHEGLLEVESGSDSADPMALYRVSAATHDQLESYLSGLATGFPDNGRAA